MKTQTIPLGLIDRPRTHHRLGYDENYIAELAASIRSNGLLNPILVTPVGERFEIIAGDCRFLAHQHLRADDIRATVIDGYWSADNTDKQIAENFDRRDLSPIEEARALHLHMTEHALALEALAHRIHRRPEWVKKRLDLLELPDDLGPLVHQRKLPITAALTLARCTDPVHRAYLTDYAVSSGASTHVLAQWVEQWRLSAARDPAAPAPLPAPPAPDQHPTIQLPCWICQAPTDWTTMAVIRLCPTCHALPQHGEH